MYPQPDPNHEAKAAGLVDTANARDQNERLMAMQGRFDRGRSENSSSWCSQFSAGPNEDSRNVMLVATLFLPVRSCVGGRCPESDVGGPRMEQVLPVGARSGADCHPPRRTRQYST